MQILSDSNPVDRRCIFLRRGELSFHNSSCSKETFDCIEVLKMFLETCYAVFALWSSANVTPRLTIKVTWNSAYKIEMSIGVK